MSVKIYHEKNKKGKFEKTKISISFRSKKKFQIPFLMVIREYYDKRTNEIVFAEVLFEIE